LAAHSKGGEGKKKKKEKKMAQHSLLVCRMEGSALLPGREEGKHASLFASPLWEKGKKRKGAIHLVDENLAQQREKRLDLARPNLHAKKKKRGPVSAWFKKRKREGGRKIGVS